MLTCWKLHPGPGNASAFSVGVSKTRAVMVAGEPLSPWCWMCSASREAAIPCWSHSLAAEEVPPAQWVFSIELALTVQH